MRRLISFFVSLAALLAAATPAQAQTEFIGSFGSPGTAEGKLSQPWGLATDDAGQIYVTELGNRRVSVFDSAGNYLRRLVGNIEYPSAVAVRGETVYLADRNLSRVYKIDRSSGVYLGDLGNGAGAGNGQHKLPEGIAIRGNEVLVTSAETSRISRFTPEGTFLGGRGGMGAGPGQFDGIAGIAAGADGSIYVSEVRNDRVQRFNADMSFDRLWGGTGTAPGQFTAPQALATDNDTLSVYVSDRIARTVQRFGATGQIRDALGAPGSPGELTDPIGVAVDCRGTVYVADRTENRINKYGPKQAATADNLLKNAGFEAGGASCGDKSGGPVPDWTLTGAATAVHYGAGGFPGRQIGDELQGGESFAAGGPASQESTLSQTIDVSAQALDIDDGRRLARISGLLGGFEDQADAATVEALYRDEAGKELGKLQLGPVTSADRAAKTALLARNAQGTVPKGTRSIAVRVTMRRDGGSYNDAYVDSLALTLTPQRPEVDGAAPQVELRAIRPGKSLRKSRLRLGVTCSESCDLVIGGRRVKSPVSIDGDATEQRVKLPLRKRAARKALRKFRRGRVVRFPLRIEASDKQGNAETLKQRVEIAR